MATEIGALAVRVSADVGDFIDAFNRADKATEKFSRQLDKRLIDPLAKISAVAAAASAAVLGLTKNAANTVDEIGKLSQKVGVSVEALSGLKYAADLSDVSLDQLGQGLKQLSKHMVENNVQGVSTEEQLLRIADEFSKAKDDANKTAAAMKYFGKAGADLIPLLNQGRAGIEELRKEAARLGVVFNDEAKKRAEEFNDNLTRLKYAAQGLQVEMAGPLVEALNKAAKEMLAAQKAGEGLFGVLRAGFRDMFLGDDAQIFSKKMGEAKEALAAAQKQFDKLKASGGRGHGAVSDLLAAEAAVKAAEARIKALQTMKDVLVPKDPAAPGAPKDKDGNVKVPDDGKGAKEAADREQQIRDILHKVREEDDKRELEQIAKQNEERAKLEEQRVKAHLDAIDYENAEAIRKGQELLDAEAAAADEKKRRQQKQLADANTFLGNLASLMNTNSRRTFEIGKKAAIAQAAVKHSLAVIDAWEAGMSVGGPWAPVVAAGYAAAAAMAGLNYINNIRSQSFGGGGGAPMPAGQGSSGIAAPAQTGGDVGSARAGQTAVINITGGEFFSRAQVVEFIEKVNEALGDGGRIVFAR